AGVAATFSAQILARTKEFGMLRHVGVSRGQIIAMLLDEGALLGAVGVIAGLGLGIAMGEVLIHVVNPQSFHWTMETRLPLPHFRVSERPRCASRISQRMVVRDGLVGHRHWTVAGLPGDIFPISPLNRRAQPQRLFPTRNPVRACRPVRSLCR